MIPHLSMLCKFIISTTRCSISHPPSWYHPTFSITELHPSINGLFSSSSEDQDWIWGADGLFNIGNIYSTFLYFSVFHIIHISLLPLTSLLTIRNFHHLQVLSKWNCRTRMFWQMCVFPIFFKASSQFMCSILKTVLKCAKPSISSIDSSSTSPYPPPSPLVLGPWQRRHQSHISVRPCRSFAFEHSNSALFIISVSIVWQNRRSSSFPFWRENSNIFPNWNWHRLQL